MNLQPDFTKMFDDMNFNAQLDEAESFNDWMPDDGEYLVVVKSVKTVVRDDKTTGKKYPGFKLTARIESHEDFPNIHKAEFTMANVTAKSASSFKTLAIGLAGKPIPSADMVKTIANSTGAVLRVKVRSHKGTDGRTFKNTDVLQIVEPAPVAAPTEAPA
jgi:hypothetical protein